MYIYLCRSAWKSPSLAGDEISHLLWNPKVQPATGQHLEPDESSHTITPYLCLEALV
jgi:hypothetical protein